MKRFLMLVLFFAIIAEWSTAQNLHVTYGPGWGISKLAYKDEVLIDVPNNIGRALGPEAFKVIRKGGKVWAEWSQFAGRLWDESSKTFYADFNWGKYNCQFSNVGDTLYMKVTFTNLSSTDTFCGMSFSPLTLQFKKRPGNFQEFFPYYGNNITKPTVVNADLPLYRIVLETGEFSNKSYLGFLEENGTNGTWYRIWSGNRPYNGMRDFDERSELRLPPKKSISYTIALKFSQPGAPLELISKKALANFRKAQAFKIDWKDRRPIGTLFLSSFQAEQKLSNVRNWSVSPNELLDIRTSEGLRKFRAKVFEFADNSIKNLKDMNAQGMITWDIEGQQYPHPLSYIGSPELLSKMAPEMEILADEYFAKFRTAGMRTGICLRPDSVVFIKENNWINHIPVKDPVATLIKKIKYARKRWGCTIFYVDSNIQSDGETMDASVFQKVQGACPDVLLIPEHERLLYYAATAPYGELKAGTLVVGDDIKATYPGAFMVLNVADGLTGNERKDLSDLTKSLKQGNILLFRAWYKDEPANTIIKRAYKLN